MANCNFSEAARFYNDMRGRIGEIEAELTARGANLQANRVIGAYAGHSLSTQTTAGVGVASWDNQFIYAYDRVTGESQVFTATGFSVGPSVGVPFLGDLEAGGFTFNGTLEQMGGVDFGVQGAGGLNTAGVFWSPDGSVMVQYGAQLSISAEASVSLTYGSFDPRFPSAGLWAIRCQALDGLEWTSDPQTWVNGAPRILPGTKGPLSSSGGDSNRLQFGGASSGWLGKHGDWVDNQMDQYGLAGDVVGDLASAGYHAAAIPRRRRRGGSERGALFTAAPAGRPRRAVFPSGRSGFWCCGGREGGRRRRRPHATW
jgi:hypothetical protein